jgi:ABC-type Fe3+/spermidine/putrescine transport system ATPase subunit
LSVNENVGFGLKMRRLGTDKIGERVASLLHLVNLDRFGDRNIAELSGGEQQRVALARALAIRPRLLMFDEPLGALDRTMRENLLNELRMILHEIKVPAIYVTHDQEEAFALADRVLILHAGRIVRDGKPEEVWGNPGSHYVAEFLGLGNVLEAEVIGGMINNGWKLRTGTGDFFVRCDHRHSDGEKVHLLVRPQVMEDAGAETGQNAVNGLSGAVTDVVFEQAKYKVTLDNGLYVHLKDAPTIGERVSVRIGVECLA